MLSWHNARSAVALATLYFLICLGSSTGYRSHSQQRQPPFRTFEFAENGVCIQPYLFSCRNKTPTAAKTRSTSPTAGNRMLRDNNSNKHDLSFFTMRNVPGTGDCMFLAVALATASSMGLGANDVLLNKIAAETRAVVAQVLGSSEGVLHIEGKRLVRSRDLLASAAKQEGLNPEEYLRKLKLSGTQGGLYGGGPELTALSNVLRRPITIYELEEDVEDDMVDLTASIKTKDTTGLDDVSICRIKPVGVFGDIFRDPLLEIPGSAVLSGLQHGAFSWHLHILVVDTGEEKHACALLPQTAVQNHK